MEVPKLLDGLGGNKSVADALDLGATAVGMWRARSEIPARFHLPLWRMALEAGLPWEPPGAADLRPFLAKALCPGPSITSEAA